MKQAFPPEAKNETTIDNERLFLSGGKSITFTTSDGKAHVIKKLSMKALFAFKRPDISFVRLIASNRDSDAIAKTALALSQYLGLRIRVVPSKTSQVQHVFFVYPEDKKEAVEAKAASPVRHDGTPLSLLLEPGISA